MGGCCYFGCGVVNKVFDECVEVVVDVWGCYMLSQSTRSASWHVSSMCIPSIEQRQQATTRPILTRDCSKRRPSNVVKLAQAHYSPGPASWLRKPTVIYPSPTHSSTKVTSSPTPARNYARAGTSQGRELSGRGSEARVKQLRSGPHDMGNRIGRSHSWPPAGIATNALGSVQ